MAQEKSEETASETLLLSLQFGASIQRVADTTRIGDWIIGFLPPHEMGVFPKDQNEMDSKDEHPQGWYISGDQPREWGFDLLPVEWFTSYLAVINEHREKLLTTPSPFPETVMRTLIHSGTFREEDWIETERISKGASPIGARIRTLPTDVRDQILRLNVRGQKKVYVLRIDDFWLEWRLVESLALLAGILNKKPILAANEQAKKAWVLLERLKSNSSGDRPRKLPALSSYKLGDHVRMLVRDVVQHAFWRVLKKPETTFRYSAKTGPRLALDARSVLAIAYLILLRHFRQGWKRCKRPDCQKLFPITDDARKIFCSQYCGHLESLRRKRKAIRQKSRKTQRRKQ